MTILPVPLSEPMHALAGAALDELELLLGGLYAPARGYCLPSARPTDWPWPFTLAVPPAVAAEAIREGTLLLTDPDGTPLASLTISDSEGGDVGKTFLAGTLSALRPAEHPPARRMRLTQPLPTEARTTVIAAFSAAPEPADVLRAARTAEQRNANLVLVAVADSQAPGRYTVLELLAALGRCAVEVPGARCALLISPRPAGSTPDDYRALTGSVLGLLNAATVLDFSGTEVLDTAARPATRGSRGAVVLLTGLSGAGKSTIARALAEALAHGDPRPVTLLDGDDVRRLLSSGLGFSREDRETNIRRIGWVASLVAKSGGIAVCAPIAPFESGRREIREMAEEVGDFVLVHVATSLDVCETRDRKGLYAKARAGALPNFTGIDSPYEVPVGADVVLDTGIVPVEDSVAAILAVLATPAEPFGARALAARTEPATSLAPIRPLQRVLSAGE